MIRVVRSVCTVVVLSLVSASLNAQGPDAATASATPLTNAHAHKLQLGVLHLAVDFRER